MLEAGRDLIHHQIEVIDPKTGILIGKLTASILGFDTLSGLLD